jgi:OTU-like cysteine protease
VTVQIYAIGRDGNCLFRAIAMGLSQTEDQHWLIRDLIVDHMLDPTFEDEIKNVFASKFNAGKELNHDTIDSAFNNYLGDMALDGSWGTDQEIVAASHLFNCSILCCSRYGDTNELCIQHIPPHFSTSVTCFNDCHHKSLYLINVTGNHYDLALVQPSSNLEE